MENKFGKKIHYDLLFLLDKNIKNKEIIIITSNDFSNIEIRKIKSFDEISFHNILKEYKFEEINENLYCVNINRYGEVLKTSSYISEVYNENSKKLFNFLDNLLVNNKSNNDNNINDKNSNEIEIFIENKYNYTLDDVINKIGHLGKETCENVFKNIKILNDLKTEIDKNPKISILNFATKNNLRRNITTILKKIKCINTSYNRWYWIGGDITIDMAYAFSGKKKLTNNIKKEKPTNNIKKEKLTNNIQKDEYFSDNEFDELMKIINKNNK